MTTERKTICRRCLIVALVVVEVVCTAILAGQGDYWEAGLMLVDWGKKGVMRIFG
jgi:hypothetical protein